MILYCLGYWQWLKKNTPAHVKQKKDALKRLIVAPEDKGSQSDSDKTSPADTTKNPPKKRGPAAASKKASKKIAEGDNKDKAAPTVGKAGEDKKAAAASQEQGTLL